MLYVSNSERLGRMSINTYIAKLTDTFRLETKFKSLPVMLAKTKYS